MVPLARLELALREETDFESVASTSSATGAIPWEMQEAQADDLRARCQRPNALDRQASHS
jgi:hypothetical protein